MEKSISCTASRAGSKGHVRMVRDVRKGSVEDVVLGSASDIWIGGWISVIIIEAGRSKLAFVLHISLCMLIDSLKTCTFPLSFGLVAI